jgi:transmembrane sensor
MTQQADLDEGLSPLTAEALRWVVRLTSGEATQADAAAFARWRSQGPGHEAAFLEAVAFRRIARTMDLPPPSTTATVVPFRAAAAPPLSRRAMFGAGGAVAASLAAWMVARPPLGLWPSLAELAADHRTGRGERRTLAPAAGVAVELNARSALSITAGGHGLHLIDGEAFVAVSEAHPLPFAVAAGPMRLELRAASLNVSASERGACVTCLAGVVDAEARGAAVRLTAGQQLSVRSDGGARVARVNPQYAAAWRRGLLIFHQTPLAEAVESVNRYRDGKIILASDTLAERPVNGLFHTDQIADAVGQIQQLLHLSATRLPGGVVLLA